MIRADFTQLCTVGGVKVFISDLSVRESVDEPVSQIDFNVDNTVQSLAALAAIQLNAPVVVTQTSQGRSITWRGVIESLDRQRQGHEDVYRVVVTGEASKLARRRFTDVYSDLGASDAIKAIMQDHGSGMGISSAGVEDNDEPMGLIIAREDTVLEVILRIAKRVGWVLSVDNGVLNFYDPLSRPAPFQLSPAANVAGDTLRYKEDATSVQNVLKSEAYEYVDVTVSKEVRGCTTTIYGPKHGREWEFTGDAAIMEPLELAEAEDPIGIRVDPFSGAVEFAKPLTLDAPPSVIPETQRFRVTAVYTIRRKLQVIKKDLASIGLYGERQGVFRPGNGGDDLETVFLKLGSELERKAFPVITASCSVLDFGLRAGQMVVLNQVGATQPQPLRVKSVRHATKGADLDIQVELTTRNFAGIDAVPEIVERVENLEKESLNPLGVAGSVIRTVGETNFEKADTERLGLSGRFISYISALASFHGGGSATIVGQQFGGSVLTSFAGGGKLNVDAHAVAGYTARFSAGGRFNVDARASVGFVIDTEVF